MEEEYNSIKINKTFILVPTKKAEKRNPNRMEDTNGFIRSNETETALKAIKHDTHSAGPPYLTEKSTTSPAVPTNACVILNKALYGLKQALKLWHEDINSFLLSQF